MQMTDLPLGNIQGGILRKALLRCLKYGHECQRDLRDKTGTYAHIFKNFILVAKSYAMENWVSCNAFAVSRAAFDSKSLVMFIDQENAFYEFDPEKIDLYGEKNFRAGVPMLNFPVTIGRRVSL